MKRLAWLVPLLLACSAKQENSLLVVEISKAAGLPVLDQLVVEAASRTHTESGNAPMNIGTYLPSSVSGSVHVVVWGDVSGVHVAHAEADATVAPGQIVTVSVTLSGYFGDAGSSAGGAPGTDAAAETGSGGRGDAAVVDGVQPDVPAADRAPDAVGGTDAMSVTGGAGGSDAFSGMGGAMGTDVGVATVDLGIALDTPGVDAPPDVPVGGSGGTGGTGGATASGGKTSAGGTMTSGGTTASGGSTGGVPTTGGIATTGGTTSTGGTPTTGGTATTGGMTSAGGIPTTGGTTASGGIATNGGTMVSGGITSSGGTTTTGGTTASGGIATNGGTTVSGGATTTGGTTGSGGTTITGGTTSGGTTASGGTGGSGGTSGGTPLSCVGLAKTCGPSGNGDCCASLPVPGGTFNRSDDPTAPATVSDFYLDKYEITVGRFRQFVNAGMGTQLSPPADGAGVHPLIPGSGWNSMWKTNLQTNTAALTTGLKCHSAWQTWTDTPGANESRPQNCINWYEASAFCAWDGGRLATEAEWNYAAAGGNEQRAYPWSSPPTSTTIDDSYAVYCGGSCSSTQNVGSKSPKGDGKWGQSDLAGNLWEWTLDWYANYTSSCNNCADLTAASYRAIRGGDFNVVASYLRSAFRVDNGFPDYHNSGVGARCARSSL